MNQNFIKINGARVHNLKNINITLPRNKLVVLTGLSGSGKSSLAFDTLYAEGQRRYVESLSAYARQFLGLMDKPDVDSIEGLSPAISIDQKSVSHNPRSTVGTVTEIYDYLRLLYARVGKPHCPSCGDPIKKQTIGQMSTVISAWPLGTTLQILAPMIRDQKGEHKRLAILAQKSGYTRLRVDGEVISPEEFEDMVIDKQKKHNIEIVVDRLSVSKDKDDKQRLTASLETAAQLGEGLVLVLKGKEAESVLLSQHLACPKCGISLPNIEPRHFSFNSPHGACPHCTGLGIKLEIDPDLVLPNPRLTVAEGAIRPWFRSGSLNGWILKMISAVGEEYKFTLNEPIEKFSAEQKKILLYGAGEKKFIVASDEGRPYKASFEGVIPNLERRYKETESDYVRGDIERYMRQVPCPVCHGARLKPEALAVKVMGKGINEIVNETIGELVEFFITAQKKLNKIFTQNEQIIAKQILKEISERLKFLLNVGLSYLTVDRAASTLSGGEAQRIRLATQIGSALVGVMYILDEPSIGLHQRDNQKLIKTLQVLRDLGNSIIVVEHDEEMMRSADWLVDIGPGAGKHGGKIVAEGTPAQVIKNKNSLTARYLSGQEKISIPEKLHDGNGNFLKILGARAFNLRNIDVTLPLGKLIGITGVSGSGKSTLITEILSKALAQHFYNSKEPPAEFKRLEGLENLDKVITIDQSPIGRTPRSNPATYTGLFTPIRDLYTQMPEAKMRGYDAGRFSFNVKGGRCEACQGEGLVQIEMHFLPDVYVECEVCHGTRYSPQILEIHYQGKSIAEVLKMTVEEAEDFFSEQTTIMSKLSVLKEVGLGYLQLGQPATTLSGGEAQRIKLATELSRRSTGRTLYILDEPTTGLHFEDTKKLLGVLSRLVDTGNTVLIIEHNLDVIKCCDHLIDLGPDGGAGGGRVVAIGTPREVAKNKNSFTGQYLKKVLK